MIHFDHVSKDYDGEHFGLRNVSLHIDPGEMVFLTGHSGAGKSTLLKLIMLREQPTHGNVLIDGVNTGRIRKDHIPLYKQQMGIILQDPELLEDMTAAQNIAMPLIIQGYRPKEIQRRVKAALEKVGLLAQQDQLPATLSTGEQQRVSIARAIVHKPKIILADEPTGNLDPTLSKEILNLFAAFQEIGVTVVIATHDLMLIANMPQRVITLQKGQLVGGEHG